MPSPETSRSCDEANKGSVCVVVLGDIGRSPRMLYHALSFTRNSYLVDVIGYGGSTPHEDVLNNSKIKLHHMMEPPKLITYLPRLMTYMIKTLWQILTLFISMIFIAKPKYIILQNPPAIPSMIVVLVVSWIRGCRLILDWHNYGYTIMGLTLGHKHPLVRFAKWYEHFFGRLANLHICVSHAMKENLRDKWDIEAVAMYDRPPAKFRRLTMLERHTLFQNLAREINVFKSSDDNPFRSLLTEMLGDGVVKLRPDRPALVVSSTSWTEDEDFSILLGALQEYDQNVSLRNDLPNIVCVITGKGPLKAFYQKLIAQKDLRHVSIITPWLAAEDYPKLLGSADLGVCLHTSSSGLDLPMKVVDMFGCQLPVCAIKYECIHELVKHKVNGLVFNGMEQLAQQLQDLLEGFPDNVNNLNNLRKNLEIFDRLRWDDAWDSNVLPLLTS